MSRNRNDYKNAVEFFVDTVRVPVGITGPLKINGDFAHGEYQVPLATTEAALVASYRRGVRTITAAGGCTTALLAEAINRTPGFTFQSLNQSVQFQRWVEAQLTVMQQQVASVSRHCTLKVIEAIVEGNHVYLNLTFETGEAAGQNMITFATEVICSYINLCSPVKPERYLVDANLSGDKKSSTPSLNSTRGKRVSAEVVVSGDLLKRLLRVSADVIVDGWQLGIIGGCMNGSLGVQAHFANALAALYIACGQDVACVAESAIGVTRIDKINRHDIYASVTLPNIIVGTVGGGSQLPDQFKNLTSMNLQGKNSAKALAEITGGLCLAGELSLIAAMCSGQFSRAHAVLGRERGNLDTKQRLALMETVIF